MSSIKNFGLSGVGGDVQFGKGGNRLVSSGGAFSFVDPTNLPVRLAVGNAVNVGDAVAFGQLQSLSNAVTGNVSALQANIANLASSTSANAAALYANIAQNTSNIALNTANIASLQSSVSQNATLIAQNTANIALNSNAIALHTTQISGLTSNVANNTAAIAAIQANTTTSSAALANAIAAIETSVGLTANGTFIPFSGTHYLDTTTTITGSLTALDGKLFSSIQNSVANAAALQANIANNTAAINAAVANSAAAGNSINSAISAEITRATTAEASLQSNIVAIANSAQANVAAVQASLNALAANVAANAAYLQANIVSESSRAQSAEAALNSNVANLSARVTSLGNVFNYKGQVDGSVLNLDAIDADANAHAGDYYKYTGNSTATFTYNGGNSSITVNMFDGIIKSATGWDKIDNTDSTVTGSAGFVAVSGSTDTGYVVNIAPTFIGRVAALEANTTGSTAALQQQINSLAANTSNSFAMVYATDNTQNAAILNNSNAIALNAANIGYANAAIQNNANAIAQNAANIAAVAAGLNSANVAISTNANSISSTNANVANLAAALANANTVGNTYANAIALNAANIALANAAIAQNTANIANVANSVSAETTRAQAAEAANYANALTTRTAIGLNANGAYVANATAHYVANAVSVVDANNKLDAALFNVAQSLSNLSQNSIQSASTLYSVKATNGDIELFGNVGGVSTLFANAVTGAAQNASITLNTGVANEVRFEAHSGSAANVDIRLVPQGTGQVVVGTTGSNGVIQSEDGYDLTVSGGDNTAGSTPGRLIMRGGVAGSTSAVVLIGGDSASVAAVGQFTGSANAVTLAAVGTASAIDLVLAPKATGVVNASNARITSLANATVNTDAVNLGQLNSAIQASQAATASNAQAAQVGSVRAVTGMLTATSATINLGAAVKGTVVRIKVQVTAAYMSGSSITVGDTSNSSSLAVTTDIDESNVGMYIIEQNVTYGAATQLTATVSSSGNAGSALVIVEYIQG